MATCFQWMYNVIEQCADIGIYPPNCSAPKTLGVTSAICTSEPEPLVSCYVLFKKLPESQFTFKIILSIAVRRLTGQLRNLTLIDHVSEIVKDDWLGSLSFFPSKNWCMQNLQFDVNYYIWHVTLSHSFKLNCTSCIILYYIFLLGFITDSMSMLTGNVIVSCTIFSMAMDLKIFFWCSKFCLPWV